MTRFLAHYRCKTCKRELRLVIPTNKPPPVCCDKHRDYPEMIVIACIKLKREEAGK